MSTLMVARFQHVREENEISISVQRLKEEATRMSKGEFMQLIPCSQMTSLVTSSHSDHTKDSSDLIHGHGAQHWYNAYMALYEQHYKETGDLQVSLDQALEVIKSLQDSLHEKNVEIERLRKKLKKQAKGDKKRRDESEVSDEETTSTEDRPYFRHGIGLDLYRGREPKLYDLSDPKGETPKKKIEGVTIEMQPRQGFAIRIKKSDR